MTSVIFLFLLWIGWIGATFFLHKNNPKRLPFAIIFLLLIILYPVQLSLFQLNFNGAIFLLLLSGYMLAATKPFIKNIYLCLAILITMLGYAGLHLLEMYDPIWVLVDRRLLLSFFLLAISWLLYPTAIFYRYLTIVIGSIHGEISYAILLLGLDMNYIIGSKSYLDALAITITVLYVHHLITKGMSLTKKFFEEKKAEQKQVLH